MDGKGQAVDERAGDQAGEAEGEGVAEETREKATRCGERSEADQEVEAEDGGWKHERKGDQSLYGGAGEAVAARQPPGDGNREEQKKQRGGEGELEGEDEGLRVHATSLDGSIYPGSELVSGESSAITFPAALLDRTEAELRQVFLDRAGEEPAEEGLGFGVAVGAFEDDRALANFGVNGGDHDVGADLLVFGRDGEGE